MNIQLSNQVNIMIIRHAKSLRLLSLSVLLLLINACSGGSGASNEDNVQGNLDDSGTGGVVYSGPSPLTDDVQAFKLNVWDNLAEENRCGACHGTGGQAPTFVRNDDINEAYNTANSLVSLSIPAESRLVTKVAGGHNCWLTNDSVCGDIITGYIEDWASVSSSSSNVVVLTAPEIKEVGQSKSFPDDVTEFASTSTRCWPSPVVTVRSVTVKMQARHNSLTSPATMSLLLMKQPKVKLT